MQPIRVLFFGSAAESLHVLETIKNWKSSTFRTEIVGVVTQPPRPVGRKKIVTPTTTEVWAQKYSIPVLSFPSDSEQPWLFENEQTVIDSISPLKPDFILVTYYGQKIPLPVIQSSRLGGLNIHPSLLPRWRGADPIPWAILWGDHQVGLTIVTLAETFDEGQIIAQKKIPLLDTDTAEELYPRLFHESANFLSEVLDDYLKGTIHGQPQGSATTPYARRLSREDGFIPWPGLVSAMNGKPAPLNQLPPLLKEIPTFDFRHSSSDFIYRMYRALHPWPGIWTTVPVHGEGKRMKILQLQHNSGKIIVEQVQLEGKTPTPFADFQKSYLGA